MLTKSLSADVMRSLALYITYAIHKPKQKLSTPLRGKSVKLNTDLPVRRKTLGSPSPRPASQQSDLASQLTQLQVALRILELYTNLLCQKDELGNIHKFARTVTNKVRFSRKTVHVRAKCSQWLLHLLADDEPAVVVMATKILARLLVVSGQSYVEKFVDKTGGVVIMQHRLKRWWNIPSLWPLCFAILFGVDVATIDSSRAFDLFGLLDMFASRTKVAVVYPAMLPIITSMLGEGLRTVTRDQSDPNSPMVGKGSVEDKLSTRNPITHAHARQRSMTLAVGTSTPCKTPRPSGLTYQS